MFPHKSKKQIRLLALAATIFSAQIIMQSIPIAQRIVINGDAMCTCGCGHTITVCAERHGEMHKNCKCEHDKDEETKIFYAPNSIDKFILSTDINFFVDTGYENILIKFYIFNNQITLEIPCPPPKIQVA